MTFSHLCIKKPVLATVFSLVLVVAGILGYLELPVRFSPQYFKPGLSVVVNAQGSSAEYVEQNITTPLEQALSATPGLDFMVSHSQQGQSSISLNFKNLNTAEFTVAQSQILQEVSSVSLPQNASSPLIQQHGDSNMVMVLGISDPHMPLVELTTYVNNYLLPRLNQISGVADISVDADLPALRLALNPESMAALGVSVNDIQNALNNSNTSYPLGSIITAQQVLQLNAHMSISDLQGFNEVVIAKKGGRLIHLKEVATLAMGWQSNVPWYGYVNGQPGFAIEIHATDSANPIAVGDSIRRLLVEMKEGFPDGLQITPVFDLATPLQGAIDEVYIAIFLAIVLVVGVTFCFLGNWRATLIPVVTIPICLLATFGVMYALGFTINVMTLLALVLAVGLVVDDAIVVLENTYRHIQEGKSPLEASRISMSEISFAILGITICLVAVYLPALFMRPGIDTVYFQEFSFSLAGAILISGFLALSLSPMMCSRLLFPHVESAYEQRLNRFTIGLSAHYERALDWVLKHRKIVFSFMLLNLLLGLLFFYLTPTDLLPKSQLNYVMGFMQGPSSVNPEYLNQRSTAFRQKLENNPELQNTLFYITEQGSAFFFAEVKHASQRDTMAERLNEEIDALPDLSGGVQVLDANQNGGSSHQGGLFFYVSGLASYPEIAHAAALLQEKLENTGGITSVFNNIQFNQQQYDVMIHRNLVTELGLDLGVLNNTLMAFLGGYTFSNTHYQVNGYAYPIVMQLPYAALGDLSVLQKIHVETQKGARIPVSSLVSVLPNQDLAMRLHINQMRSGEVDFNIASSYSVGQAMNQVKAVAAAVLPANLSIVWGGKMRNLMQNEASGNLFIILGLVFIFLVLAALFESFYDPLIILCTVPLCIVAGLGALYLMGGSINIYTKIALVTLIGLVSKHGVLITQFANQRCSEGADALTAVKEAALIRLRPILMTSLTMILGALPLILSMGTDANGRRQIGIVIVFGLLLGSLFSLFIVPAAYVLIHHLKNKIKSM